jgi:hypothetical protein
VFPHSSDGSKTRRGGGKSTDVSSEASGGTVSAVDVWHDTLVTAATVEQEKSLENNLEVFLCTNEVTIHPRTLTLWEQLSNEEFRQRRGPFHQLYGCF